MKMEITLPEGIEHYEPELRFFFDLMIRKLHICRDKGFAENCTVTQMFLMLNDELDELETSLADESQFQSALECVDVANQAWLLALVVLRATRHDFECQRQGIVKRDHAEHGGTEAQGHGFQAPAPPPIKAPRGYGNIDQGQAADPQITVKPSDHRRPGGKSLELEKE